MPAVPTLAGLPNHIKSFAHLLSSFPAAPLPRSGLRDLIAPLTRAAATTSDLEEWKAGAFTPDSIAAIIESTIAVAHALPLPQYEIFNHFQLSASVISFNWDGLAQSRCPQDIVIHPHGALPPRPIVRGQLEQFLDLAQLTDTAIARQTLIRGLILPGEEDGIALRHVRDGVLAAWLQAKAFVIIGYTFGLASSTSYDRVWLDHFVEAAKRSPSAPVHIVSPEAATLRALIAEQLKREINVHAWPLRWDLLARALLRSIREHPEARLSLARFSESISGAYELLAGAA